MLFIRLTHRTNMRLINRICPYIVTATLTHFVHDFWGIGALKQCGGGSKLKVSE